MKVSFGIAVVGGVCFSLVVLRADLKALIAICCLMFGFFGLAAYPIGLETGAECTYPVAETTSTGLIVLSGQVQGAMYIALMGFVGKPLTNGAALARETCSVKSDQLGGSDCGPNNVEAKDMTLPMMIFAAVATLLAVVFIILFKPRLKRTTMEKTGKALASKKQAGKNADRNGNSSSNVGHVEMKVLGVGKVALSPEEPLVD